MLSKIRTAAFATLVAVVGLTPVTANAQCEAQARVFHFYATDANTGQQFYCTGYIAEDCSNGYSCVPTANA